MTKIERKVNEQTQDKKNWQSLSNSDYMNSKSKTLLGFKCAAIREWDNMTNRSDNTCFWSHLACQNSCGESIKAEVGLRSQKKINYALSIYSKWKQTFHPPSVAHLWNKAEGPFYLEGRRALPIGSLFLITQHVWVLLDVLKVTLILDTKVKNSTLLKVWETKKKYLSLRKVKN